MRRPGFGVADAPSATIHVADVIRLRADFQMSRVAAKGVIARVPYNKPVVALGVGNVSLRKNPCDAMREHLAA